MEKSRSFLHLARFWGSTVDRSQLVEQARQLRTKWSTGEYVSISAAISLANRLADAVEHPEQGAGDSSHRVA